MDTGEVEQKGWGLRKANWRRWRFENNVAIIFESFFWSDFRDFEKHFGTFREALCLNPSEANTFAPPTPCKNTAQKNPVDTRVLGGSLAISLPVVVLAGPGGGQDGVRVRHLLEHLLGPIGGSQYRRGGGGAGEGGVSLRVPDVWSNIQGIKSSA